MRLAETEIYKGRHQRTCCKIHDRYIRAFPMIAERAEDMYIYDENGEAYLDFYAGIAVNSAGNRNKKVVAAVKDQVDDIMHTFNYPYTIPQALLAEKVCTTIGMDKIFFQNSGTEANEAMIKMARKYGVEKYGPTHYNIVTAKDSFHGRSYGLHERDRPAGQRMSDRLQAHGSRIHLRRVQ